MERALLLWLYLKRCYPKQGTLIVLVAKAMAEADCIPGWSYTAYSKAALQLEELGFLKCVQRRKGKRASQLQLLEPVDLPSNLSDLIHR